MATARHKVPRANATAEMLQTLDIIFLFDIKMDVPEVFKFSNFKIRILPEVPQQSNGTDCGLFVMKFMESIYLGEVTADGVNISAQNA
ncbi:Ulp1 protease family, C-terminal catalytic domain containing protein [Trema orientale]|uniref:Ulp1 protease family, C-terminal catalytic domain containing protein n=1 Tax=Trema orientale TaxID=63057 RepID=A0A2P5FRE0_TREOI|nr:Ulp1 protease family, C-terminal catalytic domain containing protein [Trema orientale]